MLIDASRIPRHQWPATLEGLVQVGLRERLSGIAPPLSSTRVQYKREPARRELWQSPVETVRLGDGDCEDLSVWLAADFRAKGIPARVAIVTTREGYHAVVEARINGKTVVIDPSKARGMGRRK